MVTDAFNHAPAQIFMNTGSQQFGRPSMGRGSTYGLGSEIQDLPAFVVFSTGQKGTSGGRRNWGCGFLPTVYQGVPFRGQGDPVLYLSNPPGIDADDPARLARRHPRPEPSAPRRRRRPRDRHADQLLRAGLPDAVERPGADGPLARSRRRRSTCTAPSRASRRTPTPACWPAGWSSAACGSSRSSTRPGTTTAASTKGLKDQCGKTDQASAALVKDLKQRGLLDDTLVIWGGEFGRTPMVQGGNDGRDHHPNAFTMWLAGGGIKPGITLGETDDLGFNAVEDRSTSTTCTPRSCTCSASTTPG